MREVAGHAESVDGRRATPVLISVPSPRCIPALPAPRASTG